MYILKNNVKGFQNIGNTCYLNAGLQMIIQNKDLCYSILDSDTEQSGKLFDFYKSLVIYY